MNDDAWKVFNRDTEAGRLLSRLYGRPPSKSIAVSYPKQRRRATNKDTSSSKENATASRVWKTTYTVNGLSKSKELEREKERKNNIERALSISVPKVGRGGGQQRHTIDGKREDSGAAAKVYLIPRRVSELGCKASVDKIKYVNGKYRPPALNAFSSEKEKARLSDIFSGGSGKSLPEELTHRPTRSTAPQPNSLFDQIYQEIIERRQHQMEMEQMRAGDATREATVIEIQVRLEQLKKLDPGRAIDVVTKLMNP